MKKPKRTSNTAERSRDILCFSPQLTQREHSGAKHLHSEQHAPRVYNTARAPLHPPPITPRYLLMMTAPLYMTEKVGMLTSEPASLQPSVSSHMMLCNSSSAHCPLPHLPLTHTCNLLHNQSPRKTRRAQNVAGASYDDSRSLSSDGWSRLFIVAVVVLEGK